MNLQVSAGLKRFLGESTLQKLASQVNPHTAKCFVCGKGFTDETINMSVFVRPEKALVELSHVDCAPSKLVKDQLRTAATLTAIPASPEQRPMFIIGVEPDVFTKLAHAGLVPVDDVAPLPVSRQITIHLRLTDHSVMITAFDGTSYHTLFDGPIQLSTQDQLSLVENPLISVLAAPVPHPHRPEVFEALVEAGSLLGAEVPLATPLIGRNDLCICGSTRKWKVCHAVRFPEDYARHGISILTPEYLSLYPPTYLSSPGDSELWQAGVIKLLLPAIKESLPTDIKQALFVRRSALLTGVCPECQATWRPFVPEQGLSINHDPDCSALSLDQGDS